MCKVAIRFFGAITIVLEDPYRERLKKNKNYTLPRELLSWSILGKVLCVSVRCLEAWYECAMYLLGGLSIITALFNLF